jgi:mRNA-degrading endonuclease RelE of RelBE toxin-antitoxin system
LIRALYSPQFRRQAKKLHPNQQEKIKDVILEIILNPALGIPKGHDLAGISVYKFWIHKVEFLLAYRILDSSTIRFLKLGPHENFYEELKREI